MARVSRRNIPGRDAHQPPRSHAHASSVPARASRRRDRRRPGRARRRRAPPRARARAARLRGRRAVGASVREWAHVRRLLAVAVRRRSGRRRRCWSRPAGPRRIPTATRPGSELVERYSSPWPRMPEHRPRPAPRPARGRRRPRRASTSSRTRAARRRRSARRHRRDGVERRTGPSGHRRLRHLDATPIRSAPAACRPIGERAPAERIAYGIPDVLGADRDRYAGRRVLVRRQRALGLQRAPRPRRAARLRARHRGRVGDPRRGARPQVRRRRRRPAAGARRARRGGRGAGRGRPVELVGRLPDARDDRRADGVAGRRRRRARRSPADEIDRRDRLPARPRDARASCGSSWTTASRRPARWRR